MNTRSEKRKKKRKHQKKLSFGSPSRETLNNILQHYQNGNYVVAEELASSLVEYHPNIEFGWKILGAVFHSTGRMSEALGAAEKAAELAPNDAETQFNLGKILNDMQRPQDALVAFAQAIKLKENFAEAHFNLGTIFQQMGQLDNAEEKFRKTLKFAPNHSAAHGSLATVLQECGRLTEAEESYRQAILLNANNPVTYNNLGNTLKFLGKSDSAVKTYLQAITLDPSFAIAHLNLGIALYELGKIELAESSFRNAIALNSEFSEAYMNLGLALQTQRKLLEAEACNRTALELNPHYVEAHNNLGITLQSLDRLIEAESSYRNTLALSPQYADAHRNLGTCLGTMKRTKEALLSYEKALELEPTMDYLLGDIIYAQLQLCDWTSLTANIERLKDKINNGQRASAPFPLHSLIASPEIIQKGTKIFTQHKCPKSNLLEPITPYKGHRRIKVGYFSPDFRDHPVAAITTDLFKNHDRSKFEIHAFSFGADTQDKWNKRVKAGVDHFHDVREMSDKDIALMSRSLEIDIAVDLTGYTTKNRVGIFKLCAAPLQIGYVGFLGTMGSDYYDYLIADTTIIPECDKAFYNENIIYLPCYQVNSAQNEEPDPQMSKQDFNLSENLFVFCCLNNAYKISPATMDSWARILQQTENSILMLYAKNDLAIKNLRKEIRSRGINPERLVFGERLTGSKYWSRYKNVDLCLDTFLYNGGVTSSDALRMGCPVLTKKGESFSSRYGASLLTALGLPELIASSSAEYEELAIKIANNPKKLSMLKEKLASKVSSCSLYNTKEFTDALESSFLLAHEKSENNEPPGDIYI